MTDTDSQDDALCAEWQARREAASKRRTPTRLRAAEAAFRAYSAHLAARVPAQRTPADDRTATGLAPAVVPVRG